MLAAGAIVAALAGGAFLLLRGDEDTSDDPAMVMRAAGCTYRTFKALPAGVHLNDPDARPKQWNSFPPTSGPHHGQPVIWGEYEDAVSVAQAVHNLEHGGIVIWYGSDVPATAIDELRRFYRDDPNAMLLSPLPQLKGKIVLSAWNAPPPTSGGQAEEGKGILAECIAVDRVAFAAFRDAYRYEGPEAIPPESLQPGM